MKQAGTSSFFFTITYPLRSVKFNIHMGHCHNSTQRTYRWRCLSDEDEGAGCWDVLQPISGRSALFSGSSLVACSMSSCLFVGGTGRLGGHPSVAREWRLEGCRGWLPGGAATLIDRADHRALHAPWPAEISAAFAGRLTLYAAAQRGVDRVPYRSANPLQWRVADCLGKWPREPRAA